MKLYLAPGACSLADHIALHEAGLVFDRVRVYLRTKRTEDGRDFHEINPKGYVPALELNDGEVLTENVAILFWIAEHAARLAPGGNLGRTRLIEMLAFIGSEIHKPFVRVLFPTSEADKKAAEEIIGRRFAFIAQRLPGNYLFGHELSAADPYLYVMLRWAAMKKLPIPDPLPAFVERMEARPAVRLALQDEGLA